MAGNSPKHRSYILRTLDWKLNGLTRSLHTLTTTIWRLINNRILFMYGKYTKQNPLSRIICFEASENHPKSHYSGKLLFAWCRDKFYKLAYLFLSSEKGVIGRIKFKLKMAKLLEYVQIIKNNNTLRFSVIKPPHIWNKHTEH